MLNLFLKIISRLSRKQEGQILFLGIGLFVLVLATLIITVDVGYWLSDKRDAQNDADAIALAAAQELPDTADAVVAGEAWAVANNIDPATQLVPPICISDIKGSGTIVGNFCFKDESNDGLPDLVRVQVQRVSSSFIAGAFGVPTPTLSPRAAAAKVRAYGACVMPWAIDAVIEDPNAWGEYWGVLGVPPAAPPYDLEKLHVFQLSPGGGFAGEDGAPGNFGALGVYGANDAAYKDTIINECGSKDAGACNSDTQTVNPGESLDCDIQTGNLGATTNKALNQRAVNYGETDLTVCDASSYAEAVSNAALAGCAGRSVVLAVIQDFPTSDAGLIDVYGIANFYIAGWDRCPPFNNGNCSGPIPDTGIVWGYLLLAEFGASPAWQFDFSQTSNNPFAPVVILLVE